MSFLTYASHPQILRKDKLGGFFVHNSYGVFSTAFDGARFSVSAAVRSACPQKEIGRSLRPIVDRTMSNKVRFLLSDTPFHCGVPGGVNSESIPFSFRWSSNSWLKYSPPRSDRRALIFLPS